MIADHTTGVEAFEGPLEGRRQHAGRLDPRVERVLHAHSGPDLPATRDEPLLRGAGRDHRRQGPGQDARPPFVEAEFTKRRALMLPEQARYDVLLEMPKAGKLGAPVTGRDRPIRQRPLAMPVEGCGV